MDTINLEVLTRLTHRWDILQSRTNDVLSDDAQREVLQKLIDIFQMMAQSGTMFASKRATTLAEWLWQNGHSYGIVLKVMFQIRKTIRPVLIREYPGVEGFLNGQMHFEDLSNYLLALISDAYCAAAIKSE